MSNNPSGDLERVSVPEAKRTVARINALLSIPKGSLSHETSGLARELLTASAQLLTRLAAAPPPARVTREMIAAIVGAGLSRFEEARGPADEGAAAKYITDAILALEPRQ